MKHRSLDGLRVLNTRPHQPGYLLSTAIQQFGGIAIDMPTLEIQGITSLKIEEVPDLKHIEIAVFISANAVNYGLQLLNQLHLSWPQHIKVITIGEATTNALKNHQINAEETPLAPDSEHLLAIPALQHVAQKQILVFKGEGGRLLIEQELKKRQAQLTVLPVYKRCMPLPNYQFSNCLWQEDAVDIILLTSEQSIHNLFKLFSAEAHAWLRTKSYLVISTRLAQVATLLGIKKIKLSHPNRIIDTLFDYKDHIHGK